MGDWTRGEPIQTNNPALNKNGYFIAIELRRVYA